MNDRDHTVEMKDEESERTHPASRTVDNVACLCMGEERFSTEELVQYVWPLPAISHRILPLHTNYHGRRFSSKRAPNRVLLCIHTSGSRQLPSLEGIGFGSERLPGCFTQLSSNRCECCVVSSAVFCPLFICIQPSLQGPHGHCNGHVVGKSGYLLR